MNFHPRASTRDNTTGLTFPFPIGFQPIRPCKLIKVGLPYIGFNYIRADDQPEQRERRGDSIKVRGSIIYARDSMGGLLAQAAVTSWSKQRLYKHAILHDLSAQPDEYPYNVIYIDWLTGKARIQRTG